jgi:hypothetical protein
MNSTHRKTAAKALHEAAFHNRFHLMQFLPGQSTRLSIDASPELSLIETAGRVWPKMV